MMSSLFSLLLLAAVDPAAAPAPALAVPVTCGRKSGSVIYLDRAGAEVRTVSGGQGTAPGTGSQMAIDELGMPVDKKDKKKGKETAHADHDCDGLDSACAAAGAQQAAVVDTYGGHGAQGMAINEQGVPSKPKKGKAVAVAASSPSTGGAGCSPPAGMAINEKGTAASPRPAKSNK